MSTHSSHEHGLFPAEAKDGVEQIKIHQRVIRARSPYLLSLGIPTNENQGNRQNLDMASEVMQAMERHSSSPSIQLCWMNYPVNTSQSVDLVFVQLPFTLEHSKESVLVRLQTDKDKGYPLQEVIVSQLADPQTRNETVRQLIAPDSGTSIDLSKMTAERCQYLPASVYDIAKTAYLSSNPARTYQQIEKQIMTTGDTQKLKTSKSDEDDVVSLSVFVKNSIFFRDEHE